MENFVALRDFILMKYSEAPLQKGRFYLPEKQSERQVVEGTLISFGKKVKLDDSHLGKLYYFDQYEVKKIIINAEQYALIKPEQLLSEIKDAWN